MQLPRIFPRPALTILAGLALTVAVCVLGIFAYSARVYTTVSALTASAYKIRTKADADRTIEDWRRRSGKDFWMESDQPGGNHVFDAVIDNLRLARLHLVQPTAITVGITIHNGQLRSVFVGEQTASAPAAMVAITEWFDERMPNLAIVFGNRRPYAAWVEFPASLPEDQRKSAFAFNVKCFVTRHVCDREDKILPAISQLTTRPHP